MLLDYTMHPRFAKFCIGLSELPKNIEKILISRNEEKNEGEKMLKSKNCKSLLFSLFLPIFFSAILTKISQFFEKKSRKGDQGQIFMKDILLDENGSGLT